MREIRGNAKNIRSLLGGAKFTIDYYQREYRWEKKQVTELIDDLCDKFMDSHEAGNERSAAIDNYGHYFLGSIIISDKDGQKFIIDGQQRITSLTLLLIQIHQKLEEEDQKKEIANLIYSYKAGRRSFNLDVEERTACLDALFAGQPFEEHDQPESIVNILGRYQDIEEHFPEELGADTLPYFADWLIESVYLVEITAYSDADAYTIFETMNDRGLSLTPTDMLKGYLLANITDSDRRIGASHTWRNRVSALQNISKDEDADAIKSWLRSQHARTIRRGGRNEPKDFDLIGTEFHRWGRDNEEMLGLNSSPDFGRFIEDDFFFYSGWYERIRQAAETLTEGLEVIYFNAQNNFTLQYPVLLAPLVRTDSETEILRKLRIVATFLNILIARRIWNWKLTSYNAMSYIMFQQVILNIRSKSSAELVEILTGRLKADEFTFASNERFHLHGMNRRQIHRLLARITDYVETCSGRPSHYVDYIQRRGKNGYEVEHIWANQPKRHEDEFDHPTDFAEYRNRIGGLLLLPKSFNASYGDKPYADKQKHYLKQNLLAQSLHESAYENDPGFRRFIEKSALNFVPHNEFKKADLDSRQELYRQIAEQIWNPENLQRELDV